MTEALTRVDDVERQVGQLTNLKDWQADDLIQSAKLVAETLRGGDPLKTQVYKVLGYLRQLEQNFRRDGFDPRLVRLFEPRLEWAVARQDGLKDLHRVLVKAIPVTKTQADFQQFLEFVQAVVARHEYVTKVPGAARPGQAQYHGGAPRPDRRSGPERGGRR